MRYWSVRRKSDLSVLERMRGAMSIPRTASYKVLTTFSATSSFLISIRAASLSGNDGPVPKLHFAVKKVMADITDSGHKHIRKLPPGAAGFHQTNIDRRNAKRVVPLKLLCLGLSRTGTACEHTQALIPSSRRVAAMMC